MKPFDVSVLRGLPFTPPNQGPQITDFKSSIDLIPGVAKTLSVGVPEDFQGDAFFLQSWAVKDGLEVPWVSFKNQTALTKLEFSFDPPLDALGLKFTIELKLRDLNLQDP